MNANCPNGYKDDDWFVLQQHVQQGIGNANCTTPIVALDVLAKVISAIYIISFLPNLIRAIEEYLKPKGNSNIMKMFSTPLLAIPFFTVILLHKDTLKPSINISLFGVGLMPYLIGVRYAILNLSGTIPQEFSKSIHERQKTMFSKDRLIRINIIISNLSILCIGVFLGLLVPLVNDDAMVLVYFRIGILGYVVNVINNAVIVWKSCSIMIQLIDSALSSQADLSKSSGDNSTHSSNSKIKMVKARTKFAIMKNMSFLCLSVCAVVILQATILPFYWYMAIYHFAIMTLFYIFALMIYPIDKNFIRRCLGKADATVTAAVGSKVIVESREKNEGSKSKLNESDIISHQQATLPTDEGMSIQMSQIKSQSSKVDISSSND